MQDLTTDGILHRHDFHGEWNYTLNPSPNARLEIDRPLMVGSNPESPELTSVFVIRRWPFRPRRVSLAGGSVQ